MEIRKENDRRKLEKKSNELQGEEQLERFKMK
jgi:hypothetical protein